MNSKSIKVAAIATVLAGAVAGGVVANNHASIPAKIETAKVDPRLPPFMQQMMLHRQAMAQSHPAPVARPAGQPNQLPLFLQQMQARRAEQAKHPQPKPAVSKVPSGTIPPFILQRMLARQRQQIAGHR